MSERAKCVAICAYLWATVVVFGVLLVATGIWGVVLPVVLEVGLVAIAAAATKDVVVKWDILDEC